MALAMSIFLVACARLPPRQDVPYSAALPPATEGLVATRVSEAEAAHPGRSGFKLVGSGAEAFALRMFAARDARTSLDIQTYIWHADLTGMALAHHVLMAADRGVKVRILVDDLDARAKNTALAALDAHPDIEVRLYNPMASRSGLLPKMGEFSLRFRRLNHRMHNKSWVVDNRAALVGGRNLGDEYFQAGNTTNFVDLDVLMAGPVVREVSASFDRFWNSDTNYPIQQLMAGAASDEALDQLRAKLDAAIKDVAASPYAAALRTDPGVRTVIDGTTRLQWTSEWRFVSDDPMKAGRPVGRRSNVLGALRPLLEGAETSAFFISPYFVPGEGGTRLLADGASRGVDVRVLTNSLAATDVASVHGGYARYRPELLGEGVLLWELKPSPGQSGRFSLGGSSGSSLHTKAAIFDSKTIFVGSYNLDPRSTSLNTEHGVLVTLPALAMELTGIFEDKATGVNAWKVEIEDGDLLWNDGVRAWTREPEASVGRRLQAWLARYAPIEAQL